MAKAQVQEVGDHAAEDQKQRRTSSWWSKPSRISPHEVLQSWAINTVKHLLVKNDKKKGALKERGGGGLLTFFPWKKGGGLLERGVNGGFTVVLCKCLRQLVAGVALTNSNS